MEAKDEIDCLGYFNGFTLNVYFDLNNASEENLAYILSYLSNQIDEQAFIFSEIKTKDIDSFVTLKGTGLNSVIGFLSSLKPNQIKEQLVNFSSKELLPAAESYFFFKLFQKAKVPSKLTEDLFNPIELTAREMDKSELNVMRFIAKYKSWIAIKKLSIDKTTKCWEVSGLLSGVNNTIVNKAFDFAGVDRAKIDLLVAKACSGKRRSYNNVTEVLKSLQLTNNKKEDAYLVCKCLETLGYKPYSSPEMLTQAHPEIKPPKVKGRKPKG
ncbi:DUF2666 family protein [Candidatus Micrarchaeota archaeon]|nr:DUF2666 family protein [Candidatus Micrarchaeota archaeon]